MNVLKLANQVTLKNIRRYIFLDLFGMNVVSKQIRRHIFWTSLERKWLSWYLDFQEIDYREIKNTGPMIQSFKFELFIQI